MATKTTSVPDGVFFELSPSIVLVVRIANVLVLLMILITFIVCLVQGDKNSAYYLLACNIVISALVGIVVNWWYRGGDLGSEHFWYILVVAGVLIFQCITIDIYVFKEAETQPSTITVISTNVFTWASFRTTHNNSLVNPLQTTPLPYN